MSGLLGTNTVVQVAIIVRDMDKAKKAFTELLGLPVPETAAPGPYEVTQTHYQGEPAPQAKANLAFFKVGENLQLELIEPNGEKSVWQDHLDEHGEGFHHIAFQVKDIDEKVEACEAAGYKAVQRGKYASGTGEYAYLDATKDLKIFLELLENY